MIMCNLFILLLLGAYILEAKILINDGVSNILPVDMSIILMIQDYLLSFNYIIFSYCISCNLSIHI